MLVKFSEMMNSSFCVCIFSICVYRLLCVISLSLCECCPVLCSAFLVTFETVSLI